MRRRLHFACRLTRILLPAQLFFFAGGVFGAVLLVRKQFNVQAVAPLIYNLGTIVGGVLLVKQFGVSSLAIGTVAGAFFGPFLLNCGICTASGRALSGRFSTGMTRDFANGCGYRCR